jgi:hypothetical protein
MAVNTQFAGRLQKWGIFMRRLMSLLKSTFSYRSLRHRV